MQIQLIVADERNKGQAIPINVPTFTIGRAEGCNLRSRSAKVSRQHCTIQVNNGIVTVQDLGGENGTFVNGNRIASAQPLKDGDKLIVGAHAFIMSIKAAENSASDQGDFFELTPSSMALPQSEGSSTQPADPNMKTMHINSKKPEPEAEVMFEIRLNGQRVSVSKSRLFDLARKGSVLPDDLITVAGTKVFADSIQGIVFGNQSSPPSTGSPVNLEVQSPKSAPGKTPAASDSTNDPFGFPDLGNIADEINAGAYAPIVRVARRESAFSAVWKALDISFSRVYKIEGNDLVIHSLKALYYVVVVGCALFAFFMWFDVARTCYNVHVDDGNALEAFAKHLFGLTVVTFGCVLIVVIVRVLLEMLLLAWVESANQEKREDREDKG